MRLIDAVDLQGKMMEMCVSGYGAEDMIDAVIEQPTVDAVPVTRCAQCKWCAYPVPNSTKYGCRLFDRCVKDDWFCADGERRTDETDR